MLKKKSKQPNFFIQVLPDIIFILLFFFMITTAIGNKKLFVDMEKKYPIAVQVQNYPDNASLPLAIYFNQKNEVEIAVDDKKMTFEAWKKYLDNHFNAIAENINKKVFLHIQSNIPMNIVKNIHNILQKKKLYCIIYVTEKKSE